MKKCLHCSDSLQEIHRNPGKSFVQTENPETTPESSISPNTSKAKRIGAKHKGSQELTASLGESNGNSKEVQILKGIPAILYFCLCTEGEKPSNVPREQNRPQSPYLRAWGLSIVFWGLKAKNTVANLAENATMTKKRGSDAGV